MESPGLPVARFTLAAHLRDHGAKALAGVASSSLRLSRAVPNGVVPHQPSRWITTLRAVDAGVEQLEAAPRAHEATWRGGHS
jgi:hypothetical protein